jgi:hypothetical protein
LAPLWDAGVQARYAERQTTAKAKTAPGRTASSSIPKDLREKLKRARGAKALLVDLEQQVRHFVESWNERAHKPETLPEPDSDDDEVVFVGRNGEMRDVTPSPRISLDSINREKLVFDSLEDDHGASFGYVLNRVDHFSADDCARRWLVHSIGQYYGLNTWSITVGNPARREAYVGIKESRLKGRQLPAPLPRPLYGLV